MLQDSEEEIGEAKYPAVIEVLIWHCYGITCVECGYAFSHSCTLRNLIREHIKKGFIFIEPSLS